MRGASIIRIYTFLLLLVFVISLAVTISNVSKLQSASTSSLCNPALSGGPCAKTFAFWPSFAILIFSSALVGASIVLSTSPRR
ncbi:MAG TPA: hypothetical protein VFN51_03880 [Candidatus Saccharimonadales bacterium]|nr:hypothetical protein [Candidatus Saccharimonadales bacterium]